MSLIKKMRLRCNEKLIYIYGGITCTILGDLIESAQKELPLPLDNLDLGNAVKVCLENSKELSGEEWVAKYGADTNSFLESMRKKVEEREAKLIETYGYKNKKDFYKNVMDCWVDAYEDKFLEISLLKHIKLDSWEGTDEKIEVQYDLPAEILGAIVRFAFTKCKGKGPYAKGVEIVSKALFPDGVPNSLEEYLESVDPDYGKYLLTAKAT